jgi:hypothetical protein
MRGLRNVAFVLFCAAMLLGGQATGQAWGQCDELYEYNDNPGFFASCTCRSAECDEYVAGYGFIVDGMNQCDWYCSEMVTECGRPYCGVMEFLEYSVSSFQCRCYPLCFDPEMGCYCSWTC